MAPADCLGRACRQRLGLDSRQRPLTLTVSSGTAEVTLPDAARAGKDLGDRVPVRFSALNVTNALFLTGFENSFAGMHYANPREVTGQVNVKFHD
jgi:hypothetical protein